MKKIVRRIVDNYLEKINQIRVQIEDKENLISLIRRLHPIKTDKPLIRLGPESDGGYLVPDDLDKIEACFSPGVFQITDFEYHCYERGMKLYLADKSIAKPQVNIPEDRYKFLSKFIGPTNNEDFITLDTWVKTSLENSESDLILQMDIEGWEYLSILNCSNELLKRFRIIVIECHNLHQLWIPSFFNLTNQAFSKLLENHSCVHIHPNNNDAIYKYKNIEIPPAIEITFYRNDRISTKEYITNFPNKLDCKNVENYPDVQLPKSWYRN